MGPKTTKELAKEIVEYLDADLYKDMLEMEHDEDADGPFFSKVEELINFHENSLDLEIELYKKDLRKADKFFKFVQENTPMNGEYLGKSYYDIAIAELTRLYKAQGDM